MNTVVGSVVATDVSSESTVTEVVRRVLSLVTDGEDVSSVLLAVTVEAEVASEAVVESDVGRVPSEVGAEE